MKTVRHHKKAGELLKMTNKFFVEEHGATEFFNNHPLILADNEKNEGILYVYNSKDLKMLKRLFAIYKFLDDLLPKND